VSACAACGYEIPEGALYEEKGHMVGMARVTELRDELGTTTS
jgi:hypothetical protein